MIPQPSKVAVDSAKVSYDVILKVAPALVEGFEPSYDV